MLKKKITYLDLDDNEITEDFYFNLSKAEITEMELSREGGFAEYLKKIIASEDRAEIIATFKIIISMTVGLRSEDGKRFIKSQDISDGFMQSNAYSTMFMELLTDTTKAVEFIRGVIPSDVAATIDIDELSKPGVKAIETVELPTTVELKLENFNREELLTMSQETFDIIAGTDPKSMSKELLVIAMQRRTSK